MNLCVIWCLIWYPVFPVCLIMASCSSIFDKSFLIYVVFSGNQFKLFVFHRYWWNGWGVAEASIGAEAVGVFLGYVLLSKCYSITACITPIPSLVKNSLLLFVLAWLVQPARARVVCTAGASSGTLTHWKINSCCKLRRVSETWNN